MAFLGGVGLMTGGSAIVAFVVGFATWTLLKGDKNDPKKILKQLEAKLYSYSGSQLSEVQEPHPQPPPRKR